MSDRLDHLLQERAGAIDRSTALLDAAERGGRELSRTEDIEYKKLQRQIDALGPRIAKAKADAFKMTGRDPDEHLDARIMQPGYQPAGVRDGQVVLARDESMSDWLVANGRGGHGDYPDGDGSGFNLGKMVAGLVTGRWEGAPIEAAALAEGASATGGALVPAPLAAQLIDRVRNASRCFDAGAKTVPMLYRTLSLARLDSGAAVAWKVENDPVVESTLAFDRVELVAKTLPVLIRMSQELFEDLSPEATGLIENELAQALGLELDRVILRGTGVDPEPKGILHQTGVTITALGTGAGATPSWDDLLDAQQTLRAANFEANAAIWNPRTDATLAALKDTTGRYLDPPGSLKTMRTFATNQVPDALTVGASTDCSEVYVGQFSEVLVGLRTDMRLQVRELKERYMDNMQIGLIAWIRADVALAHPAAFNVLTGVRP